MLVDALTEPFEHVDAATAVAIARDVFGIDAVDAERVETERDDTFRVTGPAGAVALKLAHPADAPASVDLEVAAVEHALARDPALPLARFLPRAGAGADAPTAERCPQVDGRVARCAPWMPGSSLRATPRSAAQARAVAAAQARLTAALADFEHPAADRPVAWDLQHLARLRPQAAAVPEPSRAAVVAVLDAFDRRVAPAMASLPRQVVHDDANLDNILVDPADPTRVTAILDFGDASRTARVFDLAVAASYLLPVRDGDPEAGAILAAVLDGAGETLDLTGQERELLPLLTACRLAQRLLLGHWVVASAPDDADAVRRSLAIATRQLDALRPLLPVDLG